MSKITLNEQYDYITLRTPNGNFTASRNGYKASGRLAVDPKVFKSLLAFMKDTSNKLSISDKMKKLTDEKFFATFYPEWNAETVQPKVDQTVRIPTAPQYGSGRVIKVNAKKTVVKFEQYANGVSVPTHLLEIL